MAHALTTTGTGWQRNVWALTLTVFVAFVGFQFFSPFLPLYVHELGVTDPRSIALWSGVLAAVTPAVSGLLGPQDDADPLARRLRRHHRGDGAGDLRAAAPRRTGDPGFLRRLHADGHGAGQRVGAGRPRADGDRHAAVGAAAEQRRRAGGRRLRRLALRHPLRVLRHGGHVRARADRPHRAVPRDRPRTRRRAPGAAVPHARRDPTSELSRGGRAAADRAVPRPRARTVDPPARASTARRERDRGRLGH